MEDGYEVIITGYSDRWDHKSGKLLNVKKIILDELLKFVAREYVEKNDIDTEKKTQ